MDRPPGKNLPISTALLVGSIPFNNEEEVFRQSSLLLGRHLPRIPDGETDIRKNWIFFQVTRLLNNPGFELDIALPRLGKMVYKIVIRFLEREWFRYIASFFERRTEEGHLKNPLPLIRFKNGVDRDRVTIIDTGYDEFALSSYETFRRLKKEGVIAPRTRFQVSLPTPYSSMLMFVLPRDYQDYFRIYEKGLLGALQRIMDNIPHQELAVQWDVCQEVLAYEGYFKKEKDFIFQGDIMKMLGKFGDMVAEEIELGYHLCYGAPPPSNRHILEPKDTAIITTMINEIRLNVHRTINWIHFPVPKNRWDDAYFAPLRNLNLPSPEPEVYLGLIHHNDRQGDRKRIDAALKVLDQFGIASECGFGRTPVKHVYDLLHAHGDAIALYQ